MPLSLEIKEGKGADNSKLIRDICTAIRKTILVITINRIRWLHDAKTREERR